RVRSGLAAGGRRRHRRHADTGRPLRQRPGPGGVAGTARRLRRQPGGRATTGRRVPGTGRHPAGGRGTEPLRVVVADDQALVRSGDALLAPAITRRLVERFAPRDQQAPTLHRDLTPLTPRELEVLKLLARGLSNAELAGRLQLSETTVKTHVARILFKLKLR